MNYQELDALLTILNLEVIEKAHQRYQHTLKKIVHGQEVEEPDHDNDIGSMATLGTRASVKPRFG